MRFNYCYSAIVKLSKIPEKNLSRTYRNAYKLGIWLPHIGDGWREAEIGGVFSTISSDVLVSYTNRQLAPTCKFTIYFT